MKEKHLRDIRLHESGFGFGECIRHVHMYTISYHVHVYKITR